MHKYRKFSYQVSIRFSFEIIKLQTFLLGYFEVNSLRPVQCYLFCTAFLDYLFNLREIFRTDSLALSRNYKIDARENILCTCTFTILLK